MYQTVSQTVYKTASHAPPVLQTGRRAHCPLSLHGLDSCGNLAESCRHAIAIGSYASDTRRSHTSYGHRAESCRHAIATGSYVSDTRRSHTSYGHRAESCRHAIATGSYASDTRRCRTSYGHRSESCRRDGHATASATSGGTTRRTRTSSHVYLLLAVALTPILTLALLGVLL